MSKEPTEGDMVVWWVRNPPSPAEELPVESPDRAIEVLRSLATRDLWNHRVHSNAGGLQVFHDGEWEEWYSEEGEDIDEYEKSKAAP